jgi:23S rRNA pseudouridine1911/1915/1917 synthase
MTEPLVILFEDPHCLVVAKPAGLLTQASGAGALPDEPTLERAVRRYLNAEAPDAPYLGTVHRLDRPVSGVIAWARTPKAARRLADQFARHAARKEYWAIVEESAPQGHDPGREEVWDDWLAADPAGAVHSAGPGAARARRARTRVRWAPVPDAPAGLRLPAGTSWLRLWPETGRTHQLRAQAASRGCPILGDDRYGAVGTFPVGIALHARSLTLVHPISRIEQTWVAPLPPAWESAGIVLPGA